MRPKNQNMIPQKRHLEVSKSIREEVRAFSRFTAKRKNWEFFQTSQKIRLEILRCVVVLKVFSKKRSFLVQKTRPLSAVGNHFECGGAARYALLFVPGAAVCYDSAVAGEE
jgi:hypothetical protein